MIIEKDKQLLKDWLVNNAITPENKADLIVRHVDNCFHSINPEADAMRVQQAKEHHYLKQLVEALEEVVKVMNVPKNNSTDDNIQSELFRERYGKYQQLKQQQP